MSFTFDHVAQQVPDIAAAVAWYQDLFPECVVLYEDESWAFLDANGAKLAFVRADQHPNHIAWRVSASELVGLAEQLGAEIRPHRDGTRSFYLQAPGEQWIEIIAYPAESDTPGA